MSPELREALARLDVTAYECIRKIEELDRRIREGISEEIERSGGARILQLVRPSDREDHRLRNA